MAYGVLYEFAFESTNHADCLIQILKKNYTGEVIKRKLGRPPVLKRENKDRIYGTSCEIYAECVVDGEFSQLYTSSPYEFRVEVYRNNQLLWVGFVSPELYSEPDIAPPYDVQIIATDGLGELKDYTWNPLGLTTVQGILIELLGKSGLDRSYYMASDLRYRNEYGSLSSPNQFLDIMLNLDHEEGETYYDVLQNLLSAFNFNISTYKDKWILFRETDFISDSADGKINIIDVNGYVVETEPGEFGSMRSCEYWPVGQLSVNIEPAKSAVELESPDHYKPNVLDFNSWSLKNKASYSEEENAYVLQPEGDMIDTDIYPEISQTINFDKNVAFLLGLKIKARKFGYVHSQVGIGVRVQMLGTVDGLASTYWLKKPDISSGSPSTDYVWSLNYSDFEESIKGTQGGYATSADVQDIDIVIPLHDDGDNIHAKTGQLTISIFNSSLYDSIYVYDVSLVKYEQIEGYKANVKIDNNAREENSDVNLSLTSGDRVPNYGEFFMTGIPIQPSGNGVIKLWNTHEGDKDYLSFMAQDWGRSIGLPKMRYSGVLNIPGNRYDLPLLFLRDNTYYFPKIYSFDLYNDELNVELISISAADVSLGSVVISQIAQASGQTGGTTTGGGTTGSGYVPIPLDKEMSDTSNNAVENRVVKAYVDGTFATKTSLSAIDGRVTGLEKYFATSEDAGSQIDKWNEIVDFLNATEGTTLAGILATYATKDALAAVADSKITISGLSVGLGGSITQSALRTGLGLDAILSWYDTIGKFFKKKDDGTFFLEGDFFTTGQMAAQTVGESGGGGLAYLADLYDVALASLASGDILSWNGNKWINIKQSSLVPDLSAYATKSFVTDSLVGYATQSDVTSALSNYLPLSGGTLSRSLTIGNSSNTSWLPIYFKRNGYQGFIGSAGSIMEMGTNEGYIRVGGSSLTYETSNGVNPILHAGNYSDYAVKYVGGSSIDNARHCIGYDNTSEGSANMPDGYGGGFISADQGHYGFQMLGVAGLNKLYFRSLYNDSFLDWSEIIHSGNIGEQSVASADCAKYIATKLIDGSEWYTDRYRLYSQWSGNILDLKTEGDYPVRVDLANKLATPRTIWGQSFDGTGNVDGAIRLTTSDQINGHLGVALNFSCGAFVDTTIWNGDYGRIATFKSNGNVGIGTSNPSEKLEVSGNVRIADNLTTGGDINVYSPSARSTIRLVSQSNVPTDLIFGSDKTQHWSITSRDSSMNNSFAIYHYITSDYAIFIDNNRRFGVNTTNPQYTLDVAGTVRVTDTLTAQNGITTNEITIGGIRIYVENGALKVNGDIYATGQFASGTIGN